MDLRSIKLDWQRARAYIEIADAKGERTVELEGDAFGRIIQSTDPLIRAVLAEVRPRRPDPAGSPSDASFWTELYRSNGDGWELGRATPPLARFVRENKVDGLRTLVVGCGRGHEARLFARAGAQVVGIDFSSDAIAEAERLSIGEKAPVEFRCRDLFALTKDEGLYDLVVEHCCYCAIEPRRRVEYVEVVTSLLNPGGRVVGLFYSHGRVGGPPFSVSEDELRASFGARFRVESWERPVDSVAARTGQELLAVFRKS